MGHIDVDATMIDDGNITAVKLY